MALNLDVMLPYRAVRVVTHTNPWFAAASCVGITTARRLHESRDPTLDIEFIRREHRMTLLRSRALDRKVAHLSIQTSRYNAIQQGGLRCDVYFPRLAHLLEHSGNASITDRPRVVGEHRPLRCHVHEIVKRVVSVHDKAIHRIQTHRQ